MPANKNKSIVLGNNSEIVNNTIFFDEQPSEDDLKWSCKVTLLDPVEQKKVMKFEKTRNFPKAENEKFYFEEVPDSWQNRFIKFKTCYRKTYNIDNKYLAGFEIANYKKDDDFEPYTCFVDKNGNILPYILVGEYPCRRTTINYGEDGVAKSAQILTSNLNPDEWTTSGHVVTTIAQAKEYVKNNAKFGNFGNGYQILDIDILFFLRDLALCVYESFDIPAKNKNADEYSGYVLNIRIKSSFSGGINAGELYIDGLRYDTENNKLYYRKNPSQNIDSEVEIKNFNMYFNRPATNEGSYFYEWLELLSYDPDNPQINMPRDYPDVNIEGAIPAPIESPWRWSGSYSPGTEIWNREGAQIPKFNIKYGLFNLNFWDKPYTYNENTDIADGGRTILCYRPITSEEE